MKSHILGFALLLTSAIIASVPAQAQSGSLTRSFVSSAGSDSNSCMITAPCATFAVAYTKIGANGIIAALDPGKYGPLTGPSAITSGVTINGNGWAAVTAPASGNGITINAGTADVTLIGLEIDGAGTAYNGIVLNSAGNLIVTNCTVQNYAWDGGNDLTTGNSILMQPTTGTLDFAITNTTVSGDGTAGIIFTTPSGSPSANGIIDHVVATKSYNGIEIDPASATSGTVAVAISNSIASNNSETGISAGGGSGKVLVSIDNVTASGSFYGITQENTATVLLHRSVITGNSYGMLSNSTSFFTYGDNLINDNSLQDLNGNGLNTQNKLQ